MDMERFLAQHDLIFNGLPEKWLDGLFLGNGNIGLMMWGNGSPLIFSLDKYDTWEERSSFLYGSDHTYKDLRALVEAKKFDEAKQKYESKYTDKDIYPTRLPLPRLELDFGAKFQGANARLHLESATFTARLDLGYSSCDIEGFVHADNNLFVLLIDAGRGGVPFFTPKVTTSHLKPEAKAKLQKWGYPDPKEGSIEVQFAPDGLKYYYQVAPSGAGFRAYCIAYCNIPIEGTTKQLFLLSLLSDKDLVVKGNLKKDGIPAEKAFLAEVQALFDECHRSSYSRLKEEHQKWWDAYWDKSFVTLPDNILENLYYVELYKMACNSREKQYPCTLQGIWTIDGEMPPWAGDYHLDMNVQETYWGIYASNHLELGEPVYRVFMDFLPKFKQRCKDFFGFEGAWSRCSLSLGGNTINGYYTSEFWPGNGAWLAHLFWLHWRYSQDRDFLQNKAFPFLKEFFLTYSNLLEKNDQGELIIPLSNAPEYQESKPEAWGKNPNCDLALIRFLGNAILEADKILRLPGEKDLIARVQEVLEKLIDPPADGEGLQVMEGVPLGFSHRHHSHLMGIYPLGVISLDSSNTKDPTNARKEDAFLINESIKKINKMGYWEWTGWSFPWMSAICARAGNSHLAYWFLKEYFKFIRNNSMHVNGDSFNLSFSKFNYEPMTLEGGFCAVAAILEMLLQSHSGLIRVFPAVPSSWDDIRFDNLRAEGAFIVSAMRSKGKLIYISILSEKGGICKVRNDFDNLVDLSRKVDGKFVSDKVFNERPPVLEFNTNPGDQIRLSAQPYKSTASALEKLGPTQVSIPRVFTGNNFFGYRASALNPYHPDAHHQPQQ